MSLAVWLKVSCFFAKDTIDNHEVQYPGKDGIITERGPFDFL